MSTVAVVPTEPASPREWRLRLFSPDSGPRARFVNAGLCGGLGVLGAIANAAGSAALGPPAIALAYLFGGLRATSEAVVALRAGKPDINFLMILAAVVSAVLGHWDEGVILLFLFSLSDALERFAIERTRRGIRALMRLRPETACLVRDNRETTVPVGQLAIGDHIRVRPGERMPVDGEVVDGRSSVDEAIVTGEAMPVDKHPGAAVFAGTINVNGSLLVRMTRTAAESTLAKVVALVEQAQENRIPAQRMIERWQTPYVAAVLIVSAGTILGNLVSTGDVVAAVQTGMVLLVAASPCAVVLASPVAVLAAVTRGARHGVLFKGGAHIERLAAVDMVAFDKTGTLTLGRPALTSVITADGADADRLLTLAAAVEHHSQHPLALAILRAAGERKLQIPEATEFSSEAGIGVSARVNGRRVRVGRPAAFAQERGALPAELTRALEQARGTTAIVVLEEGRASGVLALADQIRPEAAEALAHLRRIGVARVAMLTGDQADAAARVAEQLRIDDVLAGLMPAQKMVAVRQLVGSHAGVAMVGDGVNDAPALAAATVGVAMGAAGSDVALETADVVLMGDNLLALPEALHLARRCRRVIAQSLAFAGGMIGVLVLLTLLNSLILPVAVVCHEGSTVLVVLNGLRLLREPPLRAA